jgi:hypothetical protein
LFIPSRVTLMKNKVTNTISQEPSFVVFVAVSTTHRLDIMDYVIAVGYPTARMKIAAGAQFVPDLTLGGVRTHDPGRFLKVGKTKSFALFLDATVCFLPFFLTGVMDGPVVDFIPFNSFQAIRVFRGARYGVFANKKHALNH